MSTLELLQQPETSKPASASFRIRPGDKAAFDQLKESLGVNSADLFAQLVSQDVRTSEEKEADALKKQEEKAAAELKRWEQEKAAAEKTEPAAKGNQNDYKDVIGVHKMIAPCFLGLLALITAGALASMQASALEIAGNSFWQSWGQGVGNEAILIVLAALWSLRTTSRIFTGTLYVGFFAMTLSILHTGVEATKVDQLAKVHDPVLVTLLEGVKRARASKELADKDKKAYGDRKSAREAETAAVNALVEYRAKNPVANTSSASVIEANSFNGRVQRALLMLFCTLLVHLSATRLSGLYQVHQQFLQRQLSQAVA